MYEKSRTKESRRRDTRMPNNSVELEAVNRVAHAERQGKREYPLSTLFPPTLARVPYFTRWLCFVVVVGIIAALLFSIFHRGASLVVPIIVILACAALKVGLLDIPRVRNIGWSPWVLLLFLVPVANTIMQILLFAVPPKKTEQA